MELVEGVWIGDHIWPKHLDIVSAESFICTGILYRCRAFDTREKKNRSYRRREGFFYHMRIFMVCCGRIFKRFVSCIDRTKGSDADPVQVLRCQVFWTPITSRPRRGWARCMTCPSEPQCWGGRCKWHLDTHWGLSEFRLLDARVSWQTWIAVRLKFGLGRNIYYSRYLSNIRQESRHLKGGGLAIAAQATELRYQNNKV